jgi:hypothetical protein
VPARKVKATGHSDSLELKHNEAMWTAPLRTLLQAHGADAVNQTSLDVLGFPAVMVDNLPEAMRLSAALRATSEGNKS